MKKEPGVNGDWIPVSPHERVSIAAVPTIVTLGTPAVIQTWYAFTTQSGPGSWVLPLMIWIYGLMFWIISTGRQLVKSKRWEWTDEALAQQRRYLSDGRVASRKFWGHWWVRFPIGLLFLSVGIHALLSRDFNAQWISFILLMCAFVTPFVFVAEMAALPLILFLLIGFMGVVAVMPLSVIIMLVALTMVATVLMAMDQRSRQRPKRPKPEEKKEDKPVAQEAATETPAADAAPTEASAENPEAPAELTAPETSPTETPSPEANDAEDKK
jgi:membrane protein implicated in regulation of membrane protease activity